MEFSSFSLCHRYTRAATRSASETPEQFATQIPGLVATPYGPGIDPVAAATASYGYAGE